MKIRKGDLVQVMAGDDKGRLGRVLVAMPKKNQVIVEGVNRVKRHLRRSQKNPQGGRLEKEAPIDVSNVLLVDEDHNEGQGVRVGYRFRSDGIKERYSRKTGKSLGIVTSSKRKSGN